MFCTWAILDLVFSFTGVYTILLPCLQCLRFFSSISCILLVRFTSEVPVQVPNFFLFLGFLWFGFPLLILFPITCLKLFSSLHSTIPLYFHIFL